MLIPPYYAASGGEYTQKRFNKELNQLENLQEKWAYFFKHAHESTLEEIEHLIGHDLIIKKAFYALDQASWSEEDLNTYEKMVKTEMDNLAVEEQKIMDAEARGKAEEKIIMAKEMIKEKLPLETIIRITKLTKEEIEKLK